MINIITNICEGVSPIKGTIDVPVYTEEQFLLANPTLSHSEYLENAGMADMGERIDRIDDLLEGRLKGKIRFLAIDKRAAHTRDFSHELAAHS